MHYLKYQPKSIDKLYNSLLDLKEEGKGELLFNEIGGEFQYLYFNGTLKEALSISKEKGENTLITAFFSKEEFSLLPYEEEGSIGISDFSYYSNSSKEETVCFQNNKPIAFFIFSFSIDIFSKFSSQYSFTDIKVEELLLFDPLKESQWKCIQELLYQNEIVQYSHIYKIIASYHEKLLERNHLKLDPKPYSFSDISRVFRVKKFLELKYDSKCAPLDLENVAGFGYSKLRKLFKEIFGVSITQYTNDYKLRLAYQWLDSGTHNVSDCTYGLGFISVTHFGRMFKEKFDIPPSNVYKFNSKQGTTSL